MSFQSCYEELSLNNLRVESQRDCTGEWTTVKIIVMSYLSIYESVLDPKLVAQSDYQVRNRKQILGKLLLLETL